MKFIDEEKNRKEGKFLEHILNLGEKNPKYYYLRTKLELEKILKKFRRSGYRYLHISCHGNSRAIYTTLERIQYDELAKIIKPYVKKKRLFISSCSTVNSRLAEAIIPSSGCNSIIGPVTDISFSDAAIVWASFYHLMFKLAKSGMRRELILLNLQRLVNTFNISLNYFSFSKKYGLRGVQINPNTKVRKIYP